MGKEKRKEVSGIKEQVGTLDFTEESWKELRGNIWETLGGAVDLFSFPEPGTIVSFLIPSQATVPDLI